MNWSRTSADAFDFLVRVTPGNRTRELQPNFKEVAIQAEDWKLLHRKCRYRKWFAVAPPGKSVWTHTPFLFTMTITVAATIQRYSLYCISEPNFAKSTLFMGPWIQCITVNATSEGERSRRHHVRKFERPSVVEKKSYRCVNKCIVALRAK
ncbi:hypothetical protein K437DRAFT_30356 [Tilletiaria anomala UBC 951]|uniref:Uncharacterized protein n=1 Tax=Tilletiaria anomala (strain ATCC 24038 / CBS 436.72 / UBC 951) TaxID=1037660 RepID=A0A066VH05_TILAU|nr:uncharacterized protein K437DRAFT_30356 [Tilletiaria anomala UBC 951]KDN38044.1 hypothetical protein K437DRAFT_30356 [Tilletiaria anomala UBC 951]